MDSVLTACGQRVDIVLTAMSCECPVCVLCVEIMCLDAPGNGPDVPRMCPDVSHMLPGVSRMLPDVSRMLLDASRHLLAPIMELLP